LANPPLDDDEDGLDADEDGLDAGEVLDGEDDLDGTALGGALDLEGAARLGIAPAGIFTRFLDGFGFLGGLSTAGLEGRGVGSNVSDAGLCCC